jgi:hypothetical protein
MRRTGAIGVARTTGLAIVGTAALVWASTCFTARATAAEGAPDAAADATKAAKNDAAGTPAAASPDKNASGKKTKGDKAAKSRGRLPAHFTGVVSDEQREKIYAVEKEFEPQIRQLKQQLDSLTKARDEKINAVLSPEQKKKIDDLKAAAKQAREKKAAGEPKKETKKEAKEKKAAKADAKEKPADAAPKPQPAEPAK